jgi:proline iminopeptidase
MQIRSVTSKEYFDRLTATRKEWYWFEQSGHTPMFEEPEKFNALILDQILPTFMNMQPRSNF